MLRHHYQAFYLEQMSRRPQLPEGFEDVDFQHAARHADDNRECIRLLGLSFIQQGHSVSETSKLLKVTNDAVHDWLHRFKEPLKKVSRLPFQAFQWLKKNQK